MIFLCCLVNWFPDTSVREHQHIVSYMVGTGAGIGGVWGILYPSTGPKTTPATFLAVICGLYKYTATERI